MNTYIRIVLTLCFGFASFVSHGATKNIIMFIASGTSSEHIKAASYYWYGQDTMFNFQKFPHKSNLLTEDYLGQVADPSAAATSMSTGVKTKAGSIGIDHLGRSRKNLFEYCRENGVATGLISTTPLYEGFSAGFSSHSELAEDKDFIIRSILLDSKPNILLGSSAGFSMEWAEYRGYEVIGERKELKRFSWDEVSLLSGQFGTEDYLSWENETGVDEPKLSEMTRKSIELLSKQKDGFFLLVDSGNIASAGHNSNLLRVVEELKGLENSVQEAIDFAKSRNDTLVLVAGDVETGGLEVMDSNGIQEIPSHQWTSRVINNWRMNTKRTVPLYILGDLKSPLALEQNNSVVFDIVTENLGFEQ